LSAVAADLAAALGIHATLLPMCETPVATRVATDAGVLAFQEYFVQRQHQDAVRGLVFDGIDGAYPPPGLSTALHEAEAVVFCPSNPLVSIGPILAVPGMRLRLTTCRAPRVAVSPIVGGQAIKGPAAEMLAALGHEVSALGVARLYAGLIDGMVIDTVDAALAPAIAALGMAVEVTDTIMRIDEDRELLAAQVLDFAARLPARGV
jgi:LPPG:FO 2-phospho-L-lactate transferase